MLLSVWADNDSDFLKDAGLKGLSFSQFINLLKNKGRHISSCDPFITEWISKRSINQQSVWFTQKSRNKWPISYLKAGNGCLESNTAAEHNATSPLSRQPGWLPLSVGLLLHAPLGWAPLTGHHFEDPVTEYLLKHTTDTHTNIHTYNNKTMTNRLYNKYTAINIFCA